MAEVEAARSPNGVARTENQQPGEAARSLSGVARTENQQPGEAARSLSGLLSAIARREYHQHGGGEVTEELLRTELFPDQPAEAFRALYEQMSSLLKSVAAADMDPVQLDAFLTAQTRKCGGVTSEQAAALARFWRSQRVRIRESLQAQSRWGPGLRGLSWRVDLQTAAGRGHAPPGGPVALVELELGTPGQDSEFVCLELDEAKVNQVLSQMCDVQLSIDRIAQRTQT